MVTLPLLEDLWIDGFECVGEDLQTFLKNHSQLQSLKLYNLDIAGSDSFSEVLTTLGRYHDRLEDAEFHQIAQSSLRIVFRSMGEIQASEVKCRECHVRGYSCPHIDWMIVTWPDRHRATIEKWEGIQHKLSLLRDDFEVTQRPFKIRTGGEEYGWFDRDSVSEFLDSAEGSENEA